MREFRVYFQVTQDFFETVQAERIGEAIRIAQAYVEENIGRGRFGASQSVDIVKVEDTGDAL